MPEPSLLEAVTGKAPAPAPTPQNSLLEQVTGIPSDPVMDYSENVLKRVQNTQEFIDGTGTYPPQLDHNQRPDNGVRDPRMDWSGPDDRTILQRFVLGSGRQIVGAGLDIVLGIPAAGANWLAASTAASAKAAGADNADELLKTAHGMNQVAGALLRVTDEVAGRPVVTLPDWVPLFGNQDAIRVLAGFAPIPFIGGLTAERQALSLPMRAARAIGIDTATKGGQIAAHLGTAIGFNLALTEAQPAYHLASAKNTEETSAALSEAGQAAIASGAMGVAFFGLGYGFNRFKTKMNERVLETRSAVKGVNEERRAQPLRAAAAKSLQLATINDTLRAGTPIGDSDARAARSVADAETYPVRPDLNGPPIVPGSRRPIVGREGTGPPVSDAELARVSEPQQGPILVDNVGIGGMDTFLGRDGKVYFSEGIDKKTGIVDIREINEDGSFSDRTLKAPLSELQWIKPTLDPSTPVPALRAAGGTVVIGEGLTHLTAGQRFKQLGYSESGMEIGVVWGPEKKFYTYAELHAEQTARAERAKALITIESADRLTEIAADTARGQTDHGEGREPMSPEERQAYAFYDKQLKAGKSWHDPDIRGDLPPGIRGWWGYRHIANMLDIVARPKTYMTPEERQGVIDVYSKMQVIMHDGQVRGEAIDAQAKALFPRTATGPNKGALAQLAASTKDPLNQALSMEGFNDQEKAFVKEVIPKLMTEERNIRTASGVQGEKEFVQDYLTRAWKIPKDQAIRFFEKQWDKLEIGPVRDMHTFHRVFKIYEAGLAAGFTPRFDHIGTLLRSYIISTSESVARTIGRQQALELGSSLDLVTKGKVPGWKQMGNGKDPYFAGRNVAPDFAKAILPMFERPPQLALLEKIDRINYISKRYGLGLDFYQIIQSVRSMSGISLNPVALARAYKGARDVINNRPELLAMIAESNVRLGELPGAIAKDILEHRERREIFASRGVAKSFVAHPLDGIRFLFDKVEEFSIKEAFTLGKVMRTVHEVSKFEAKFTRDTGRAPTREDTLSFMKKIAPETNNIFAGLDYATLGRTNTMRSISRMVLLAPDWTESRFRLYAKALSQGKDIVTAPIREVFGERGAMARSLARENTGSVRSALTMAASMGLLTEVLNLAINGHTTDKNEKNNRYYVQLPFKTKYGTSPGVNLWGYSEMPLRMLEHFFKLEPEAFYNERRAPAVSLMFTWLANQDNFGEQLKGEVPGMRPPTSEMDKRVKVGLQKALTSAGMIVPSFLIDMAVAADRTMRDGALDQVRWMRSVGGFFSIKVSSGYPQELRQRMQFFEDNESWVKGEYKRLKSQGKISEAHNMRDEWNGNLKDLSRMIASDPTAAHVFAKRKRVVEMMKIAQ